MPALEMRSSYGSRREYLGFYPVEFRLVASSRISNWAKMVESQGSGRSISITGLQRNVVRGINSK